MEQSAEKTIIEDLRWKRNILGALVVVLTLMSGLVAVGCAAKIKKGPSVQKTFLPFRLTELADHQALCQAIKESDEFEFDEAQTVYVSCQDDQKSVFACRGEGSIIESSDFCSLINGGVCPCDPGQIVDASDFDGRIADICVEDVDPGNPLCVELGGDLEGLLAGANSVVFSHSSEEYISKFQQNMI